MIRLLVVDDEQVILDSFKAAFTKHKDRYIVDTVLSAEDAVLKLKSSNYDIVFTDLKMPGMDGLQLLNHVRSLHSKTDTVMMTGYSTVDSAVSAMKYGALEYITKPFSTDELFDIVNRVLSIRESKIREKEEIAGFQRFSLNLRIQHILLITFFTLLTISGVPLFFPDTFQGIFLLAEGSVIRGWLHRLAGVGLIGLSFYHILYIMITDDGHINLKLIMPKLPKDLIDVFNMICYNIGLRKKPPQFGKYNWIEKFEYFAVVWGTVIMAITGLMLWFSEAVLALFPVWVVDIAKVIHSYEAILAILSIIIWHMYTVHLKPEKFPMDSVWLTGQISRSEMINHYPLEYERLTGHKLDTQGKWGESS